VEKVGSINTYLGLTKEEQAGDAQPAASQSAQQRLLLLSVLNGVQVGLTFDAIQSRVGDSITPQALRDLASDLLKRGLVEVKGDANPLNPLVKITTKGQEQLSLWA
jgi:predicted transcriptional regulator